VPIERTREKNEKKRRRTCEFIPSLSHRTDQIVMYVQPDCLSVNTIILGTNKAFFLLVLLFSFLKQIGDRIYSMDKKRGVSRLHLKIYLHALHTIHRMQDMNLSHISLGSDQCLSLKIIARYHGKRHGHE